jgi:hypothetical protein
MKARRCDRTVHDRAPPPLPEGGEGRFGRKEAGLGGASGEAKPQLQTGRQLHRKPLPPNQRWLGAAHGRGGFLPESQGQGLAGHHESHGDGHSALGTPIYSALPEERELQIEGPGIHHSSIAGKERVGERLSGRKRPTESPWYGKWSKHDLATASLLVETPSHQIALPGSMGIWRFTGPLSHSPAESP